MNQAGEARAEIRRLFPQEFKTYGVALTRSRDYMTGVNRFTGRHFAKPATGIILH
jgi:hypothetical protein